MKKAMTTIPTRNKTMRVRLDFVRDAKIVEHGFVYVEVPVNASLEDIYKAAYDKEWVSYLVQERKTVDEDYAFVFKKRGPLNNDNSTA